MIWKIAGMYPIQNTNIEKTVIEYLWRLLDVSYTEY